MSTVKTAHSSTPTKNRFVKNHEDVFRTLKRKDSEKQLGCLSVLTKKGEKLIMGLNSIDVKNGGEIHFSATLKDGSLNGISRPSLCMVSYCTELSPL